MLKSFDGKLLPAALASPPLEGRRKKQLATGIGTFCNLPRSPCIHCYGSTRKNLVKIYRDRFLRGRVDLFEVKF